MSTRTYILNKKNFKTAKKNFFPKKNVFFRFRIFFAQYVCVSAHLKAWLQMILSKLTGSPTMMFINLGGEPSYQFFKIAKMIRNPANFHY